MYKVSKNIMLSTSLVLLLSACGGGEVQKDSSVSLDQSADAPSVEKSAPYMDEVLTPQDMPKISRDENLPQNTIIGIDKNNFIENEKVVVNLNNMLGHQDWCGIYKVGSSNDWENVLSWKWTGDIKNGEIALNGLEEGDYEVRAFFRNSFNDVARAKFSVQPNANGGEVEATVSASSVNAKEKITVHLDNISVRDRDWIGIYKQGSSNDWSNVLSWAWTGDIKSGDVSLEGLSAGTYDIRVFYHNSFDAALKTTLQVQSLQQGETTISLDENSFKANESITVNLKNMPGNDDDWVGIYKAGSNNDWGNVVSWTFTEGLENGSITLDGVPSGSYDVRVFFNNSYNLEVSKTITVSNNDNGDGEQNGISQLALFADEHNPHNRLLAFDYGNMELVEEVQVAGSNNHHADVVGTVSNSKYVMMVPKNSKFVTFRDIKTREFIKKLELPMRPRSADAYNSDKNLILLTAADRPAAVLIDADSLNIVGKAGFNISCDLKFNQENYFPWYYKRIVYKWNDIPENQISCVAPDFGGQNISGHPRWLSSDAFTILDRANRLIHIYKIQYVGNGQYTTKLTDTVRTSTSLHQIVPEDENVQNGIFYGMTEGNSGGQRGEGIAPVMYKFKYSNGRLKQLGKTSLVTTQTVQMMKEVNVYDKYIDYNKKVADVSKQYYQYYYPSKFGNYDVYYPGDYSNYYSNYFNSYKNYYNNDIQSYENYYVQNVPYEVQQTLKSLGGHNLYLDPAKAFLYGAVASGQTFVVNKDSMKVTSVIPSGEGAGHVNFAKNNSYGIITNHTADYVTIFDSSTQKFVKNINLGFEHENISTAFQSHSPYTEGNYFYNTWTDGGVFFRIDMDTLTLDASEYVGGVPIQGNYFPFIEE